jgi:N-acetylmuramoyl-L-alanine amidase
MKILINCLFLISPIFLISCGKKSSSGNYNVSTDYKAKESYVVDNNHSSKDQNYRISSLILHYTAEPLDKSLEKLTTGNVSSHYLVPETQINGQRLIYQLVEEKNRAYHAGESFWKGRSNLNDTSIGIEIVNLGFKNDEKGRPVWYPYPDYQIDTVVQLTKNIVEKYKIYPTCVIGHSDIAPGRKEDPGPLFRWEKLAENGIGAWPDSEVINLKILQLKKKDEIIPIKTWQENLKKYGYNINLTGIFDKNTKNVTIAFQMHFRPKDFSGNLDIETFAILEALLEKYNERASCGF